MGNSIIGLEKECEELNRQVEDLEKRIIGTKEQENAKLEAENQAHRDEV